MLAIELVADRSHAIASVPRLMDGESPTTVNVSDVVFGRFADVLVGSNPLENTARLGEKVKCQ